MSNIYINDLEDLLHIEEFRNGVIAFEKSMTRPRYVIGIFTNKNEERVGLLVSATSRNTDDIIVSKLGNGFSIRVGNASWDSKDFCKKYRISENLQQFIWMPKSFSSSNISLLPNNV